MVRNIEIEEDTQINYSIESSTSSSQQIIVLSWNDISEAWLLVERASVPSPGSIVTSIEGQASLIHDSSRPNLLQHKAALLEKFIS